MSFPRDAYPYTNFHELNLGYFIVHFREIFSQWADLYDQMLDWKDATTDELAAWKTGVEADLDQREATLKAELETWKAQTGQDIAGWEDATLAALKAWQTATQAVFEAIRVEAAGSATAAAASAGDAATAKTAAETAQAAAEAAAASVQASAAQIATNTGDIADLKTQIINANNGIQTFFGLGNFQHYGLNDNATFNTNQLYRVSNNDPMTFDRTLIVHVANGFRWGYFPFTGGTAGAWSGWKRTDFVIPAGTSFIVQIARVTEDATETADVYEFLNAVTFETRVHEEAENAINIAKDIDYRNITIVDGAYIDSTNGNAVSTNTYAYISIDAEGLDGETATIRTKLYSGGVAGWAIMLKDGSFSSGGTTENETITLPVNVGVVKICCYKQYLPVEDIECECNFSKQIAFKKDVPNITPLEEQLIDESTILYSEEKSGWVNGFINSDGGVTSTSTFKTSDFIELYKGSVVNYKITKYTDVRYVGFYDANKNCLSTIVSDITNNWQNPYSEGTLTIPATAKFFRMTFRADNDTLYGGQSINLTNGRINVLEGEVANLKNKFTARVLIIGDSYSADGGKWVDPMMDEFSDDSSYISLAVTSATVKDQNADRTTYPYTSRPVSSNTAPNSNTFGCQIAKLKRLMTGTDLDEGETAIYQTEAEYPNIIIIQGGENDSPDANTDSYSAQFEVAAENVYYKLWDNPATQGTAYLLPDIDTVNRTIFAGAYRYVVEELYTLFPKAQFFFTTTSPVAPHRNPVLIQREKVAEQQRLCANMCCASVIDWQAESQMSIITNSVVSGSGTQADPYIIAPTTQDSTDGLHPTEYGGKKLGKLAASVINSKFMYLS